MRWSFGCGQSCFWWSFVRGRCENINWRIKSTALAVSTAAFLVAIASLAMAATAFAENAGDDSSISALRAYVQLTDTGAPTDRATIQTTHSKDAVYDALHDFAQNNITNGQTASGKGATKLAAAEPDNFLDWMRQKENGGAPAEKPVAPARKPTKSQRPPVNATTVGSKVCLGCHAAWAEKFNHTLMGRLQLQGKLQCETCHGPGSEHVRLGGGRGVGGILSFEADDPRTPEEKNAVCLGCHERGQRTLWQGSVHEQRRLACVNCHTIMKAVSRKFQLKTAFEPDTCFQCHKDRRAQMFRSSHMPLREGKIVCSDCHNPHGSVTAALLKKDSINDVCYTCHAEKRGPFLWEHAPVRENCDNCHEPHGSVHMYSLKLPRPRLCNECHNLMNNSAGHLSQFSLGQSCNNCHTAVHGSNAPNGQLLFR